MTVKLPGQPPEQPPAGLDWSPFAQQIVDDAQAVLGFPYILLSQVDSAARTSQPLLWSGQNLETLLWATRVARRLVGYDTAGSVQPIDGNPLLQAVCDRGETVIASIEEVTRGLVPPLVARIAAQIAGAAHCLAIPLCVENRVLGSLSCYQRSSDFTEAQIRTAQAFARQVALSIHNKELLDEQRRTHAALEVSRRLVAQAEDRTRRDISEFLHSQVQSKLLVAWYKLGEIPALNADAQQRLEEVRQDLEVLREHDVRRLSHLLHPEALSVGLLPALQVLVSRMSPVLEVQIVTDAALLHLDDGGDLPPALRLVMFRTVEEALNNVLKHAQARQVTVWLTAAHGVLALEVTDDGQGFDVTRAPPGLGLLCLGARIEAVGGQWGIGSQPGGPTRLWAEWHRCPA